MKIVFMLYLLCVSYMLSQEFCNKKNFLLASAVIRARCFHAEALYFFFGIKSFLSRLMRLKNMHLISRASLFLHQFK